MSDQDEFDARLAARFEQEQTQVPADAFVATTMRKVRTGRRLRDFMRVGLWVAVLVAIVVTSPWLIAGVARLNATLGSLLTSAVEQTGAWVLGALAVLVVVVSRVLSR